MQNIKLIIEYDGTRYQGWQRPGKKENSNTVSGKITETLQRMTGESIELTGSVKTEPGVHAYAQTAHFKTASAVLPGEIRSCLNRYLPLDISVLSADPAPERFHAALNAKSKSYLYRIDCSPVEDVFLRKYRYHAGVPLQIEEMNRAAALLTGVHDFRRFSSGKNKKSTGKELSLVQISDISTQSEIQILLKGSDFLHRMPLLIIGTLLDIGMGRRSPDCIPAILEGTEKPSPAAEARGLFLKCVEF